MDPLPPELAHRFAALQAHFRAGLDARRAEIEAAAQAGLAAPENGRALVVALHRLAGAAASFGFPALGAAARAAEQVALTAPGSAHEQRLQQALEALSAALAEAQAPPPAA